MTTTDLMYLFHEHIEMHQHKLISHIKDGSPKKLINQDVANIHALQRSVDMLYSEYNLSGDKELTESTLNLYFKSIPQGE